MRPSLRDGAERGESVRAANPQLFLVPLVARPIGGAISILPAKRLACPWGPADLRQIDASHGVRALMVLFTLLALIAVVAGAGILHAARVAVFGLRRWPPADQGAIATRVEHVVTGLPQLLWLDLLLVVVMEAEVPDITGITGEGEGEGQGGQGHQEHARRRHEGERNSRLGIVSPPTHVNSHGSGSGFWKFGRFGAFGAVGVSGIASNHTRRLSPKSCLMVGLIIN